MTPRCQFSITAAEGGFTPDVVVSPRRYVPGHSHQPDKSIIPQTVALEAGVLEVATDLLEVGQTQGGQVVPAPFVEVPGSQQREPVGLGPSTCFRNEMPWMRLPLETRFHSPGLPALSSLPRSLAPSLPRSLAPMPTNVLPARLPRLPRSSRGRGADSGRESASLTWPCRSRRYA